MLAIEVEYLMGRAVASDRTDRARAEWPPHPQRLFSALVATHFEAALGADSEAALRWLETLPPPAIAADDDPVRRDVRPHFVPVNDAIADASKVNKGEERVESQSLRGSRARQPRFFPAVIPSPPTCTFIWDDVDVPGPHRDALVRLLNEMTYLGHSSSPVRACLVDRAPPPVWRPDDTGDEAMNVPGEGRFDRLCSIHTLRLRNASVEIPRGRFQRYDVNTPRPRSTFGWHRVLAISSGPWPGVVLGLEATIPVMRRLRDALLSLLGSDIPEVLSGHAADGPAVRPHLALAPLAHVGTKYADGSVKGFVFLLPRDITAEEARRLDSALDALTEIRLGAQGVLTLEPVSSRGGLAALRFAHRYARVSRVWRSVTPVVLDRHPKGTLTAEAIIGRACERIGLPAPRVRYLGRVSRVRGAPDSTVYATTCRKLVESGVEIPTALRNRCWRHVEIVFDNPVRGPILIGAGRFFGFGVLMAANDGAA